MLQPSLAEMFKKAEGSWECPGCLISNKAETVRCPACQTLKPGADAEEAGPAAKDNPFAPAASGGFGGFTLASSSEKSVFGGSAAPGGGFKFGSTASDDQKVSWKLCIVDLMPRIDSKWCEPVVFEDDLVHCRHVSYGWIALRWLC